VNVLGRSGKCFLNLPLFLSAIQVFACMASCLSANPQNFNQCDPFVIAALADTSCHMSTLKFESATHTDPRDCSHVKLHAFATISEFGRVLAADQQVMRSCRGLLKPYVVA